MFDLVADLLALMLSAPCTLILLTLGAVTGWNLGGHIGLFVGAAIGITIGAWLDISSSTLAARLRWPVALAAALAVAMALLRWFG